MSDPINIRASSIASIIDCPLRGLSIQLGLVKQLPSTPPALIGSACHEGTAVFDRARIQGSPISADDAAEAVVEYITKGRQLLVEGRIEASDSGRFNIVADTVRLGNASNAGEAKPDEKPTETN